MRLFNSHIATSLSAMVLRLQYMRCSARASAWLSFRNAKLPSGLSTPPSIMQPF
jgi:hypothetical protein